MIPIRRIDDDRKLLFLYVYTQIIFNMHKNYEVDLWILFVNWLDSNDDRSG